MVGRSSPSDYGPPYVLPVCTRRDLVDYRIIKTYKSLYTSKGPFHMLKVHRELSNTETQMLRVLELKKKNVILSWLTLKSLEQKLFYVEQI